MFRKKKSKLAEVTESVPPTMHDLADAGADLLDEAIAIVTPLVAQASERAAQLKDLALQEMAPAIATAKDQFGPAAGRARDRIVPAAASAAEHLAPLAATARERSAELAEQARTQLAPHVQEALEQARTQLAPHVHEAMERAQPHLEHARQRVQDDLVPQLTDMLHRAAEHPAVIEATARGSETMGMVREQMAGTPVVARHRRSRLGGVVKVMAAGAVLAAVAVAVRQFLASKEDDWQAHRPSQGYVPSPASSGGTQGPSEPVEPEAEVDAESEVDAEPEVDQSSESYADAEMIAEGGPVVETDDEDDEVEARAGEHGEGSYVGDEPPEGFVIKGNERSMKYHVPGSGGYERTIADVWFATEEAAQEAGFTRAQR